MQLESIMPELTVDLVLRFLASFLLGSIPFALIAMIGSGVDIRTIGSGNPGFNNVLRVNKLRAIFCLIGDIGKGALAVLIFYKQDDPVSVAWILCLAVMLGHCYSPFLRFNGGKGIAASTGVMLVLYPALALGCIVLYVLLRTLGRKLKWPEEGALASLICWALFAVAVYFLQGPSIAALAAVMFAIVTWRHRDNLQRLVSGAQTS